MQDTNLTHSPCLRKHSLGYAAVTNDPRIAGLITSKAGFSFTRVQVTLWRACPLCWGSASQAALISRLHHLNVGFGQFPRQGRGSWKMTHWPLHAAARERPRNVWRSPPSVTLPFQALGCGRGSSCVHVAVTLGKKRYHYLESYRGVD